MQTRHPAAADPPARPRPVTAFVQPMGIGLLVALAFVGTYLVALHKPQPHQLPVGVLAPPGVVAQLQRSLSTQAGDAVTLRPVADATAARHQLEQGQIVAAWLPSQDQGSRLLLAGAQGTAVTQAVTGIFTHAAAQGQGARLRVDDLVPLSAADPRGFSGFYVIFGVTLAGFVFGQASRASSRGLPLGLRLVQALGFAVLAGLASALLAGRPLLGVLPGPLLALAGVLVLLALAVALVTMALTALLGDAGIVVATLLLVILGNATSGGVVPASFLPGGFRQLSPALPPGAATRALARVDYFDAAAALGPVVVLAAWALSGLLVLVVVRGRRQMRPVTIPVEQAEVAPQP